MSDMKKDHRLEDIMMYAEGALTPEERVELEEHMRGCPECQATLETVKQFLPALQKALVPDEQSPEELLAWAKAQLREEERGEKRPAGFFTRMRFAMVGFALAGVAAIVIAIEALLPSLEPALVAKSGADAGATAHGGYVAAPRRPGWDAVSDAGSVRDGGEDAGLP